jgi:hypothetical protein
MCAPGHQRQRPRHTFTPAASRPWASGPNCLAVFGLSFTNRREPLEDARDYAVSARGHQRVDDCPGPWEAHVVMQTKRTCASTAMTSAPCFTNANLYLTCPAQTRPPPCTEQGDKFCTDNSRQITCVVYAHLAINSNDLIQQLHCDGTWAASACGTIHARLLALSLHRQTQTVFLKLLSAHVQPGRTSYYFVRPGSPEGAKRVLKGSAGPRRFVIACVLTRWRGRFVASMS